MTKKINADAPTGRARRARTSWTQLDIQSTCLEYEETLMWNFPPQEAGPEPLTVPTNYDFSVASVN